MKTRIYAEPAVKGLSCILPCIVQKAPPPLFYYVGASDYVYLTIKESVAHKPVCVGLALAGL